MRELGKEIGKQVAEDVRYPLRNPGYLAMEVFAATSLGAGSWPESWRPELDANARGRGRAG